MTKPLRVNKTAGYRILLVEDDDGNALVSSTLLELLGCPFDLVRTGRGAVEAVGRGEYSVILMDLVLPDISGMEASELIRLHEKQNNKKPAHIIALSAQSHIEGEHLSITAGMNGYLSKPLQLEELKDKISAA